MPVRRRKQSDRLADVNVAVGGLAEGDDARVQTVDQRAQGKEVEGALVTDIQTSAHFV